MMEEIKMKYLNSKKDDLMKGYAIMYRGKAYWLNWATMEIYATSQESFMAGVINGYKVADITADGQIVKA
nr:MAG TPA: hypothetical protein [Caudoviricetes sp.]